MKNIHKSLIGVLGVAALTALLLCGCLDEQDMYPTTAPSTASAGDSAPEQESVADEEGTTEPGDEKGEVLPPDEGVEDEIPDLPDDDTETDLPVQPDNDPEVEPPVQSGNDGDDESDVPPFFEGDPGEDTGDWGELH